MSLVALLYSSFFVNEVLSFIADQKKKKKHFNPKSRKMHLLAKLKGGGEKKGTAPTFSENFEAKV